MVIIIDWFPLVDENEIDKIVDNTYNTWQSWRSKEEKKSDTRIWKIAEAMFENYLSENFKDIKYWSYDKFRKNNYKKHAPLDWLIINNNINKETLVKYANKIVSEVSNSNNWKLSIELKKELEDNWIFTVEIKSTRVWPRHLRNGNNDEDIIKNIIENDDFIAYPRFKRDAKNIILNNIEDYIKISPNIENEAKLRLAEKENMYSFYIRVYINEKDKKWYLMWYINKDFYSENFIFKSMPKYWKSEWARYLWLSLEKWLSIKNFKLN